jgi:hypothetical protein
MTDLWLPPTARKEPKVADHLVEGRKDFTAQLLELVYLEGGILDEWNPELKKIDPLLRLGQAVEEVPAGFPLIPGYFHLLRFNMNAPPTVTPITGPNDSFAYPTSRMLDRLRESDLQNRAAVEARRVEMENRVRAEEREKTRFRDARREELFDRLASARETRISFDRDHAWTQNVNGRRARG